MHTCTLYAGAHLNAIIAKFAQMPTFFVHFYSYRLLSSMRNIREMCTNLTIRATRIIYNMNILLNDIQTHRLIFKFYIYTYTKTYYNIK